MMTSVYGIFLGIIAALIWATDMRWLEVYPDVVVVVLVVPLAFFLAKKHAFESDGNRNEGRSRFMVIAAVVLLLGGMMTGWMTAMAWGWSCLAVWCCFPRGEISRSKLIVLCAGAFPWILYDFNEVGWLFRLTAANITGGLFFWCGYAVETSGTYISIDGIQISVEAACSGMQLLQVLMSGGVALALIQFPTRRAFWLVLSCLPLLAWGANTLRVIVITWYGVVFGVEKAAGIFHNWGGLLVIGFMVGIYGIFVALIERLTMGSSNESSE